MCLNLDESSGLNVIKVVKKNSDFSESFGAIRYIMPLECNS